MKTPMPRKATPPHHHHITKSSTSITFVFAFISFHHVSLSFCSSTKTPIFPSIISATTSIIIIIVVIIIIITIIVIINNLVDKFEASI